MKRRLYFLFPDVSHAVGAVDALRKTGVGRHHQHAIARQGVDLSELPPASTRQQHDTGSRIGKVLWSSDLAVFFVALSGLILSLYFNSVIGTVVSIALMLITFVGGVLFTHLLPHVHLDEFHNEIGHGEVLLMVDVPKKRVLEVEDYIRHHHPEAVTGGASWTVDAFSI